MSRFEISDAAGPPSQRQVDACNREFYGRFTYPWPPMVFPSVAEAECGTIFLNQELGDWRHRRVPRDARIWVAGCGTNQAIFTALRFPDAEVLGTDISVASLDVCRRSARQLGIGNLRLEERSLNSVTFLNEFDYVICTGVIHHNADPSFVLRKLSGALRLHGVLELMVYNYYHRTLTTAFQKAIRALCGVDNGGDLDLQMAVTNDLIEDFPMSNAMGRFLQELRGRPEAMIADFLLQPVEHSYTIASLAGMMLDAGLEFLLPCCNQFDVMAGNTEWNLSFASAAASERYDGRPDVERWQISNLLMAERSPMLWFYLQRGDSGIRRKSQADVCRDFLAGRFERYAATVRNWVLSEGEYRLSSTTLSLPSPALPRDSLLRDVVEATAPERTMLETLNELGIDHTFKTVDRIRLHLTTPLFPYLKAI
jgi:SAM-dependent methyltransferase